MSQKRLGGIMELTARVHIEDGSYWASVTELPGCFASGNTLAELFASLSEGITLYLADDPQDGELAIEAQRLMRDPAYVSEALEVADLLAALAPEAPDAK